MGFIIQLRCFVENFCFLPTDKPNDVTLNTHLNTGAKSKGSTKLHLGLLFYISIHLAAS